MSQTTIPGALKWHVLCRWYWIVGTAGGGNKRPTNDCCRVRFHPFLSCRPRPETGLWPEKKGGGSKWKEGVGMENSSTSHRCHLASRHRRLIENVTPDWFQTTIDATKKRISIRIVPSSSSSNRCITSSTKYSFFPTLQRRRRRKTKSHTSSSH